MWIYYLSKLNQSQSRQKPLNKQQLETLFASIDSHLWTPPNNTPSTLIREDRSR